MTNVFEQPWLLLTASAVVLLAVAVFRALSPQGHKWWLWLLPVLVAASAFALDFFVQTDTKKVKESIAGIVKAAENENVEAMGLFISDDYHDSLHKSKEALLRHCRSRLSEPIIEKNVRRIVSLNVNPPGAAAVFTVRVVFDPQGPIYEYRKMMLFKLQADLRKRGDDWLFTRFEVLAIDLQSADWRHMQVSPGGILN